MTTIGSTGTSKRKRGRGSYWGYSGARRGYTKRRMLTTARGRALTARRRGQYGRFGGENKYVDGYFDVTDIAEFSSSADSTWAATEMNPRQATAAYGCMPLPRQGTNYADRDGRKIFLTTLRIKGYIRWEPQDSIAIVQDAKPVRVIIVKDTKTNGAALDGENVIGAGLGSDGLNTLSGNGGTINMLSNPDGWSRYKIVYDRTFKGPARGAWGDNTNAGNILGRTIPFKIKIKCNCYVNFSGTTGAVGSVVDNSYHMLVGTTTSNSNKQMCYYARQGFRG